MIPRARYTAGLALLVMCLAGCFAPRVAWAQESGAGTKEEPRHELLFKTINFLILIGALGYILRKPAGEFFRSRSAAIAKGLEEGRKAREGAEARLRELEAKLARLGSDIAAFQDAARREMDAERERLQKASAEEAERILASAHAQMETALRAAKLDLKKYAAAQSVALAEQMVRARLDDSAQRRLVTQFAAGLEAKERKN